MDEALGYVSLWTGVVGSEDILEQFLTFRFTEDGDAILPPFALAFEIEWFDDDFREMEVHELFYSSLSELLAGCSYDNVIVPRFSALLGDTLCDPVNAVVLLYNFNYNGRVMRYNDESILSLTFRGVVHYD